MKFRTTAKKRFEVKINKEIVNELDKLSRQYDINKNEMVETFLLYGIENFDKVIPSKKEKCPYCNENIISLTQHCTNCGRKLYWNILPK